MFLILGVSHLREPTVRYILSLNVLLGDWSLLMPLTGAEGIRMGHENLQWHNVGS